MVKVSKKISRKKSEKKSLPHSRRLKQLARSRDYAVSNGEVLIELKHRSKQPKFRGWQKSRPSIDATIKSAQSQRLNVGFLNNQGCVDVDVDAESIQPFLSEFLPPTSIYGRKSKPSSHRRYWVNGEGTKTDVVLPDGKVELRIGDNQTAAPGSIHPSGELYVWEDNGDPEEINFAELERRVRLAGVTAIVNPYWQESIRDDLATALCGVLLRAEYPQKQIDHLLAFVATQAGDEEIAKRLKANRLSKALKAGEHVPGIPRLRDLLGPVANDVLRCLAIDGSGDDALQTVRADQVTIEPINWLWPERFALGKLSMIGGDPGTSKSTLSIEIAARVTTGTAFPDREPNEQSGSAILLAGEDDAADTIVPRFLAAGGDPKKLHILNEDFTLKESLKKLEALIEELGDVRLIIIDPITEYLGNVRNTLDVSEIRKTLGPLTTLLRRHSVAGIAISHLNKDQSKNAIYRMTGTIAYVAIARAVYIVAKDPDDPERRIFVPAKNNIGPDRFGLAYRVIQTTVDQVVTTRIQWEPHPVEISPDELLGSAGSQHSPSPALDTAKEWIQRRLEDGPVPAAEMETDAEAAGITSATLKRAKRALGVRTTKLGAPGDGDSHWEWSLPV